MTGAGRYAELAAAVHSFKAELLQPSRIERIVEAGSLSETVSILTGGRITSGDASDLMPVESFLMERIVEIANRLAAYAPHDSRHLIRLFASSFEYACIKDLLRAVTEQADPEEAMIRIVPVGKFTSDKCQELIESHNPNRIIETLDDQGLRQFLAPRLGGEKGVMAVVSSVDQYYYERLWAASRLPDPLDSQSARGLVGEFIDHLNIVIAFRARLIGLDARSTSDMMIPVNFGLGSALSELSEATNTQNLTRTLDKTPYARVMQGPVPLDGGATFVEVAFNRSHASTCLNAFAGSPFNVGLALAFLFLKNYELRDLYAIINGKANNVSVERVTQSLILRAG